MVAKYIGVLAVISGLILGRAEGGVLSPENAVQIPVSVVGDVERGLRDNAIDLGVGPQSPRDIRSVAGNNDVLFSAAPEPGNMNLCNIHFHKGAEHMGGEFTQNAKEGVDGFSYTGSLTSEERSSVSYSVCPSEEGALYPGDTVEVHYVYSTARVKPGSTLGACFNESIGNPQLRVVAQVYVLVNDKGGMDFRELARVEFRDHRAQAPYIPTELGEPVEYAGSTTGAKYNGGSSPFQVSWSVYPEVAKIDIETMAKWCEGNVFLEKRAHEVRRLVTNPDLLSNME